MFNGEVDASSASFQSNAHLTCPQNHTRNGQGTYSAGAGIVQTIGHVILLKVGEIHLVLNHKKHLLQRYLIGSFWFSKRMQYSWMDVSRFGAFKSTMFVRKDSTSARAPIRTPAVDIRITFSKVDKLFHIILSI